MNAHSIESTSPTPVSNGRPAGKPRGATILKALEFLVLLGIAAAVGVGLWSATRGATHQSAVNAPALLPDRLAGLALQSWRGGADAMQAVEGLHGIDVGLLSARIGYYESDTTVWIGTASDDGQAATLVDRMTTAILEGNTAFVSLAQTKVAGLDVHQVRAGGQLHFYYQKGKEVIWVAARPGAGGEFVNQMVQSIP